MAEQNIKQNKHSKPLLIVGIAALVLLITVAALLITTIFVNKPGANASVKAGTLESDKYGTFVIPEENMFIRSDMTNLLSFTNGTDFTYFFDEYMDKLAKYRKIDVAKFKAENQMLFQVGAYNVMQDDTQMTEEEFNAILNAENYPFTNSKSYNTDQKSTIALILDKNKLNFDEEKYAKWNNTPKTLNFLMYNMNCVPKTSLTNWKLTERLTHYEESFCAQNIKCLSKKVEITVDNETTNYYIPVAIISDKGIPLTESIYNEITDKKA